MTRDILGRLRKRVSLGAPVRSSRSILSRSRGPALIVVSVAIGAIGWSGNVLTLPLALVFPALWAFSPCRTIAAAVSAGYFLAASRGLPQGVATYFGSSVWACILLWLLASLFFVSVHTALWTRHPGRGRFLRYGAAAILMAVPPFGIVGWAHPITAAGVLLPGWGWCGLVATAIVVLAMTTRIWPLAAVISLVVWIWSAAIWTDPLRPDGWQGIDTALSAGLGVGTDITQHRVLLNDVRKAAAQGARVVVLPESAFGVMTPTVEHFWTDGLGGLDVTVIGGAVVIDPRGYDNVMMGINRQGGAVLYRERMPVPVSMWQPWRAWIGRSGGARAHIFTNPVVEIAGRRVTPLICYEQLIVWPVLQSMLHRPAAIVAIGNGWWAAGTSIAAIQIASIKAWSRLFDVPLVTAFNS